MNNGIEKEEEGRKEKEKPADEIPAIEPGGGIEEEGPGWEEKPESERGNIREVGEREETEAPKLPPSGTRNWSKPELSKGEG